MSDAASPAAPPAGTQQSQTPPHHRSSWLPPAVLALSYLAFWQIAPRLRADSEGAVLISTLVSLALIVTFAAQLARAVGSRRALLWNVAVSALLALPLRVLLGSGSSFHTLSFLLTAGLPDLLFVWFAASLGVALSFLLRSANMIPPVAAVLAVVDIWTVRLGGPVQRIMESATPLARAVSRAMTVELPAPSVGAAPIRPVTVIGFADFLFIAFFVAGISRFVRVPGTYGRTLKAILIVLSLYMLVVHVTGLALPALLPLAAVVLVVHWRRFRYSRSEAFALLYAALLVGVLAAGFWFLGRRTAPTADAAVRPVPADAP